MLFSLHKITDMVDLTIVCCVLNILCTFNALHVYSASIYKMYNYLCCKQIHTLFITNLHAMLLATII